MDQNSPLPAIVGVAVAFAVVVPLGFFMHHDFPWIPEGFLGAMLALMLPCLAFGVFRTLRPQEFGPQRRKRHSGVDKEGERSRTAFREAKRLRIAELNADPSRRKYAALMERGGWWTDEQIAYLENPNATATCAHLGAIEHAMRAAGIVPRLLPEVPQPGFGPLPRVRADCRIHEPELLRRFAVAGSVRHLTGFYPERAEFDNPWAELSCSACGSAIELVHPQHPRPTTVWFPFAPQV
jgi:hypothetical protein